MICHHCKKRLERHSFRGKDFWKCPQCSGAVFSILSLKAYPESKALVSRLRKSNDKVLFSTRKCPHCSDLMRALTLEDRHFLRLEICDRCHLVWFEKQEYQVDETGSAKFGERQPQPPTAKPIKKREKIDETSQGGILDISIDEPVIDDLLKEVFYLPSMENAFRPKLEAFVVPVLVMFFFIFSFSYRTGIEKLGFDSAMPWRLGGLTWVSSLFIHAGIFHLVSNAYFTYLCGKDLEGLLGPSRFLSLFFLGGMGGNLLFLFLAPKGQITIGASGAVMALLTYYACSFPRARLVFFKTFWFYMYGAQPAQIKTRINIWIVWLGFVLLDLIGLRGQMGGQSPISHLSHLGGTLIGFLTWLADREEI